MNQIIRNGFKSISEEIFNGLKLYKLSSNQAITVEILVAALIFFKSRTKKLVCMKNISNKCT